jgi:hypothetical protein
MTIKDLKIKEIYEYDNLVAFLKGFQLIEKAKKLYEIKDIEEIYSSSYCDEDEITEWLEKSDEKYTIAVIENRHGGYFEITEYEE